ncbi:MAG: hypothetical protein GX417_03135 [Clostridiales bacterium]|nr:hypothetical protein [Clostridiales bacterium]
MTDRSILKRVFAFVLAAVLIVAFGCGKAALDEKAAVSVSAGVTAGDSADGGERDYNIGIYSVDEATDESESGSYASSNSNENAILVQSAGVLTMTSADINKTGDAEGNFFGLNAAVAVISQGQLTLLDSNVTTNALGGYGLYVSGAGSVLTADKTYLSTAGDSSPALVAAEGGALAFTNGTVTTEGTDSPCVLLSGGSVSLAQETLFAKNSPLVRAVSGENELSLDNMSLSDSPAIAADATLILRLTNGAAFTGALGGELPARSSVYLDETSSLTLTGDTYLSVFANADVTHQNVQSNGFYIYYDSNAPENEYLSGQSYLLPGGGFLAPII